MESLREEGGPFIASEMLDLKQGKGYINLRRWLSADGRQLMLVYVVALKYYYRLKVATNRLT